jgi:uncharacterized protein (TIGR00255 family)
MTGYAYREKTEQDVSVSVEIKGYNNKYLEIYINLPPWLSVFETNIRSYISSVCGRGKIEVFIRIREYNVPVSINVNKKAAKTYFDAINNLANTLKLKEKPCLNTLIKMDGVLETEKSRDNMHYWNEIYPLFQEALNAFVTEKEREGRHTEEDIVSNLEKIILSVKTIESFVPVIESTLKENVKTRFNDLLGNQIDENRMLAEIASMLVKYTISEEISRLNSHLKEFRVETEKNSKPGKKLDFLCQEINREINTIGSKSAIIEVTGEVIKMKEALENIREQLRNVE